MKQNVGSTDRLVRIGISLVLGAAAVFANVSGATALALGVGAIVLLTSALGRVCPLYSACGVSTRRKAAGGA